MAYNPTDKIRIAWAEAVYENEHINIWTWLQKANVTSPIERIMGEALAVLSTITMENLHQAPFLTQIESTESFKTLNDGCLFQITAQFPITKYRADFVIRCTVIPTRPVVIECDGHNFHEKTKEQAQTDKMRDRDLQKAGYNVLRFTGSEIYRDPVECCREIFDYFCSLLGKNGWDVLHEHGHSLWEGR